MYRFENGISMKSSRFMVKVGSFLLQFGSIKRSVSRRFEWWYFCQQTLSVKLNIIRTPKTMITVFPIAALVPRRRLCKKKKKKKKARSSVLPNNSTEFFLFHFLSCGCTTNFYPHSPILSYSRSTVVVIKKSQLFSSCTHKHPALSLVDLFIPFLTFSPTHFSFFLRSLSHSLYCFVLSLLNTQVGTVQLFIPYLPWKMTSFLPTKGARALHWVLKIGNLKQSMAFFENVLGMRVMR